VAIAAALLKVGAGIDEKLALVNVAGVLVVPPQADNIMVAPDKLVAKGSKGAPANVCSH
jgi:hypothetical protein